jgi:type III pantothenate kinase
MMLCLDIGNTHIFAGVFMEDDIKFRFRYPSKQPCTSDQFGLFLKSALRENNVNPKEIKSICISSVVPSLDYSIISACIKYFGITPLELKPGIKTGLQLNVKNPLEIGADRIANAVAAVHQFPNKDIIVVDFGTATTLCAISKDKVYLGGVIIPGVKVSMDALYQSTAKLFPVDILKPEQVLGKTTTANIQSGLYYGQLGAVKEIMQRISQEYFMDDQVLIVATGGYAHLFADEGLFSINFSDLVLYGLKIIWEKNSAFLSER